MPLADTVLAHVASSDAPLISAHSDSNRLSLLAEYLALQPSPALCRATERDEQAAQIATLFAARLSLARDMQLPETPSEAKVADLTLEKCILRAESASESLRDAEDRKMRQRAILALLYPTHPVLNPILHAVSDLRRRIATLRKAMRDQTLALAKLSDAANLLMLISDHIQILNSCYGDSCPSSSSEWSSEDDAPRISCLGRVSDERRAPIYISSVPANYRLRYLRKCWALAAQALTSAVALSSFIARHLERVGQTELVPGIESMSRPSLSLFELPGGLLFIFRSGLLQKMSTDSKTMRESVRVWQGRQRKFITRIGRDLAKARKSCAQYDAKLADLRRNLLVEEFSESSRAPS